MGTAPLVHIAHKKTAKEAWDTLEALYSPRDISLLMQFHASTLDKYPSVKEFLRKVDELSAEMKARKIGLPDAFLAAWIRVNLEGTLVKDGNRKRRRM